MDYTMLRYEKEDAICVITLHRPDARNALNEQVRAELYQALEEANKDSEVKGVILTGGPEVFCGGADIKSMAPATPTEMFFQLQTTRRIVEYMESMPKPVIAAISGYALGGGCEITLGCDLRVASETAVLGQPEIRLGIIPGGGGTQRLSRLVGLSRAKDLIFSGKILNAQEALEIGLVDEVVPVDDLLETAKKKMKSYIRHGAVALATAKAALNLGMNMDLQSGDILEKMCFTMLFSTEDQKEGMQAFMEKRKASFKGK